MPYEAPNLSTNFNKHIAIRPDAPKFGGIMLGIEWECRKDKDGHNVYEYTSGTFLIRRIERNGKTTYFIYQEGVLEYSTHIYAKFVAVAGSILTEARIKYRPN